MLKTQPLKLTLPSRWLNLIQQMLAAHVPNAEVWAYGSRVTGGSHDASDLDLVVRNPGVLSAQTRDLAELRGAFVESKLPIRVDVLDWAAIPESFHREILRAYVVLQSK